MAGTVLLVTNAFQPVVWVKYIVRRVMRHVKMGYHVFHIDPYY